MSWEMIYRCDKCGEVITKDRHELHLLYADEDATVAKYDLCPKCVGRMADWVATKPETEMKAHMGAVAVDCVELDPKVVAEETSKTVAKEFEYAKKKAGRPKKIDEGKVKALTDAGWDVQKIADEMKITESQVRHALSYAEKKDE